MSTGSLQIIYEEMLAGKTVAISVTSSDEIQVILGRLRVIKSRYDSKTEAMFGDRVSEGKVIEWKHSQDNQGVILLRLKNPDTPKYNYEIVDVPSTSESSESTPT